MATDAEIRAAGFYAVPQQKYLQNPFQLSTNTPVEEETESFGIPQTQAFTNSGGGGGGGPTGDLINNFNTSRWNRQYNLNNPNKVNQFVNKGMEMFGMTPQRSVRDMLSPQDLNFGRNEFNEDTLSYDRTNMPGVLQPDVRKTSDIPLGIGAMIARGLPDKYYDMNTTDQAYTQANMGYTGPTIFGENLGNQDPFGRNVRSAFGNYAEAQQKSIDKMNERIGTKSFTDKYGSGLSLEEDEDGNYFFTGGTKAQMDYANKMHKMNLSRYTFDKKGLDRYDKIKNISQLKKQQRKDYQERTGQELDAADRAFGGPDGTGDYDEYSAAGGTPNYSIPDTNDPGGGGGGGGYSQERNDAGVQSAEDDMKDGGRAGYFFGGRARLQGGGMSQGNQSNIDQSTNMGGGTSGDFSTAEQTMNHNKAIRNAGKQTSTVKNIIDVGSELNYLNNLKNLNLPGIALGFGVNKFRDFISNKKTKEEEDKLSALPNNNYFAEVQKKDLDASKMKGFKQQDYPSYKDQMEMLGGTTVSPYEFKGLQDGTITTTGTFTAANGGRAMFKNGGLASIL